MARSPIYIFQRDLKSGVLINCLHVDVLWGRGSSELCRSLKNLRSIMCGMEFLSPHFFEAHFFEAYVLMIIMVLVERRPWSTS